MAPPPPAATLALDATELVAGPGGARPTAPIAGPAWRKLLAFAGPGYLVAVGYMDPGNWATDLAGGSHFGYLLLSVIVASNGMALILQSLSARLGIVTGLDLAQACRAAYGRYTTLLLWVLCEIAIIACELAEVIGMAVALRLLFGLPLVWGVGLTLFSLPLITVLERGGGRRLETFIIALMLVVALCLGAEVVLSRPDWAAVAGGLTPDAAILHDPAATYLAIGILGATVMPHNLYLHSAVVRTRVRATGEAAKRQAIRFTTADSAIALSLAMLVNAAILIVAAATFHAVGRTDVVEIGDAYHLLAPMLGTGMASILFGVALLASGQNSTITGALAGQIVMEGFTGLRIAPWARRAISRAVAIVPAALVAGWAGEAGVTRLLVLSQVVLSLQLPFAVVPLVRLTSDRRRMGALANPAWLTATAWVVAAIIIALNVTLLTQLVTG